MSTDTPMITLNDSCKRLTWQLDEKVHAKMIKMTKITGLSQAEVANLVILYADWDKQIRPILEQFIAQKKVTADRKRKASDAMAALPESMIEKLSKASPEELAELLSKLS